MKNIVSMQQVHGNNVTFVDSKNIGQKIQRCDGLITNDPKIILKVSTADCLPISIVDNKTKSIGLLHAGWRGLENGIIKKGVEKMITTFSSYPLDFVVQIGPHICAKHYEIKKDVADKFLEFDGSVIHKDGKIYLDIGRVAFEQLVNSGVKKENIKVSKICTYEDTSLSSYRRGDLEKRSYTYLKIN